MLKTFLMDDTQASIFRALADAQTAHNPVALVTVLATQGSMPRHASSKMLVRLDGSTLGTIGGGAMEARVIEEALAAIADGQPRVRSYTLNSLEAGDAGICGGTAELFIDPINVAPALLVIGGGHVGKALCELAGWAGFRVILSDDRPEFCNPLYVPDLAGYIVCPPSEIPQRSRATKNTCCVTVVDFDLSSCRAASNPIALYRLDRQPASMGTDCESTGRRNWSRPASDRAHPCTHWVRITG